MPEPVTGLGSWCQRRRSARPSGYLVLSSAVLAGMSVQTWGQRWSGDYWLHRAAVLELRFDPWSPAHPLTPSTAADPSLSPYTLALGLVARVTGAEVGDVLSVAALSNLVLFLVGLHVFVRRFSRAPWAPFWTLLATLFLWGIDPWRWSGYLNANSIGFGLPYPSMFAMAMMLFGLSGLHAVFDAPHLRHLVTVTASAILVVLSHPFTGAAMAVASVAVVIGRVGPGSRRAVMGLTAAAAVTAVVVLAWPYFPILGVLLEASDYDAVHARLYRLVALRTFLVLPALVVVAVRLRADHRDPLGLATVLAGGVFAVGWSADRHGLGRMLPLAMLGAHVALGVWVAERGRALWRGASVGTRFVIGSVGAAALLLGVVGTRAGLARAIPGPLLPAAIAKDARLDVLDGGLSFLETKTSRGDVLLAAGMAARVAPGFGAKVVAPGYLTPLVPDVDRRRADVARFFATASTTERRRIIERYGATLVLFDAQSHDQGAGLGHVVHRDERFVLVAVEGAGRPPTGPPRSGAGTPG